MTIIVDLGLGLAAGLLAILCTLRWPRADPAEPTLSTGFVAKEVATHPGIQAQLRRHLDPNSVMGALLTLTFVGVAVMAAACGLISVMIRTNTGIARLDQRAAQWGADHASASSTTALRVVSQLGGTMWGTVILVIIAAVELRRTRRRAVIAFLVMTVVGQNLIVNATKVVVSRARPSIDQLTGFSSYSFPSGHSAQAAALNGAIALLVGRGRSRRTQAVLAGIATAIAISVAASRVLLGVHWLTDVIGGLAVGWGWFALISAAFGGRWLHFGAPVVTARREAELVGRGIAAPFVDEVR